MSQKIRIKLKSYDYSLVDKSAEKIVKTVKATGAVVSGPIPLPTHKRIFTVNRSTFVNKKSREQFELSSYKRLIDIYSSTAKTVDALMKLELPSGVEVPSTFSRHSGRSPGKVHSSEPSAPSFCQVPCVSRFVSSMTYRPYSSHKERKYESLG